MLVRLEVSGFKNLLDLSMELGPFTCLAGPNAVGKSNVFDAIRFLSLLSDHTLLEAALGIRGSDPETTSLESLFWTDDTSHGTNMKLAAEMIVDGNVVDDFGRPARATSTFLRYEIELGYLPPGPDETLGRIQLLSEDLKQITEGDAPKHLRFEHSATSFRKAAVVNRRSTSSGYISTRLGDDGQTEILIHGDGGSRGSPRRSPASKAPRTIVGTIPRSWQPNARCKPGGSSRSSPQRCVGRTNSTRTRT